MAYQPSPSDPRILVINHDIPTQERLRSILRGVGFHVLTSDHLLDPDDLARLSPAIIVTEITFNGSTTGWDYLRQLRNRSTAARIPVIICTEDAESIRMATAEELSLVTDMVLKPLDTNELLRSVDSLLCPGLMMA